MADNCVKEKESENPASVSQKKVLVRNLPLSTNNQDLENVFTEIGPILNAFVARNKGQTEGCRGFGFVVFAHVEDAEKAVNTVTTLHGRQLVLCFANKKPKREKRKLKQGEKAVDDGDDKHAKDEQNNKEIAKDVYSENQEPPAKKFKGEKKSKSQRKNEGNELGRTVEITGLTYGLKPDHIQKRCGKIGKVEKVTFPVEGREKATAFVVFESRKDATEVVTKLSGRIFKGKTINAVLLSREGKAPSQESPRKSRLIVRNLSFKCKPEKLRVFFSKFGQVKNVYIPKKSDGERKHNAGFGFVQFSNVFEAARAIKESNTKEIFGRPIAVDWAVRQRVYEKKALDKGLLPLESFRLSKTNKAIRLEKKEKRRETPQRKREAKKKRKLGQTMEGHPDESNQTKDLNRRRRKTANERTWKEIKGRQNCPPKVPVARKLVKNGQQERKQVSRVSLGARKSDMSTHSAEASPASKKKKLESSKKRLSKNVPETGGSSSLFANGAGNLVNKSEKEQE